VKCGIADKMDINSMVIRIVIGIIFAVMAFYCVTAIYEQIKLEIRHRKAKSETLRENEAFFQELNRNKQKDDDAQLFRVVEEFRREFK
jgi:hypothetical protein